MISTNRPAAMDLRIPASERLQPQGLATPGMRTKMRTRSTLAIAILTLCCATAAAEAQTKAGQPGAASIVAAGSGANLAITRVIAAEFMKQHPGITVEVPTSIGSTGAVKAVADGAISIGLMSRELRDDEKSPGLTLQPYARTAIAICAHPSVAEEGITSRDLIEIFRGTKTRWNDGNQIVVQSRERNDSAFSELRKAIPGFEAVYMESIEARRWTLYFTDQDANQAIVTKKCAIGVTDLGMIASENLNVKVLKLDGVLPTLESLQAGQYPLSRTLYFVYRQDKLSRETRIFMDFVHSERGAEILKTHGYIPLK